MLTSNKTIVSVISFLVLSVSTSVMAQSVATAGNQCTDSSKTPFFSCINPDGGNDVRLYIEEQQECMEGNVISVNRVVSGHVFGEPQPDYTPTEVKVIYSSVRLHIDDGQADNMSIVLPKSAHLKTAQSIYQLEVTSELEADYEDANMETASHYKGSFKKLDSHGAVLETGRLFCSVNR